MKALLIAVLAALGLSAYAQPGPQNSGAQAFRQCVACHALEPGHNSPAGPTLHALVGRPVAALPGFNYSPALRRFAARNPRWTRPLLDAFLADPEGLVPGTEMGFVGLRDDERRAALIAWLDDPERRN